MLTGINKNLLIWTIVILAVLNISTLATIIITRNQTERESEINVSNPAEWEDSSLRYSTRSFGYMLDLDEEQMVKFSEFNPIFRQKVREINLEMNEIRSRMLGEMAANESDTDELENLADSIGSLHAELKKLTYRYYNDIKSICDKTQKEKLEELFGSIFISDSNSLLYGRGWQQGGQGRQGRQGGQGGWGRRQRWGQTN